MEKRYKDILVEEMTRKGYKIVSSDESNFLCNAPVSVCRRCSICEEGKHFEKIGSDGLTISEREKRPLTDKQIKMREKKKAIMVNLSWCLVGFTMVLNFDFVASHFGYWFRPVAAILYFASVILLLCSLFIQLKTER